MTHTRSLARIYAFQFLYHLQYSEFEELRVKLLQKAERPYVLPKALQDFERTLEGEELPKGKALEFAHGLIDGVFDNYDCLLEVITRHSRWTWDKMNPIDRTILMQAIYELLFLKDIPHTVIIDEAIELAKAYSNQQAGSFINGVLDSISKEQKKNS